MNAQAVVLGFDTSCYTTSVAAVDLAGNPVVSCRKLLPVAMGERGLRQSDALFIHVRQLPGLVEELAEQILEFASSFIPAARDDMTALVAGIWKRR